MIEAEFKLLNTGIDFYKSINNFYINSNRVPPIEYFNGYIDVTYYMDSNFDKVRVRVFKGDKIGTFYNGGKVEVTTKRNIDYSLKSNKNINVRDECSFMVETCEHSPLIYFLNSLGYYKQTEFTKRRISYRCFGNNVNVSYDFDYFVNERREIIGEPWLEVEFTDDMGLQLGLESIGKTLEEVSDISTVELWRGIQNEMH